MKIGYQLRYVDPDDPNNDAIDYRVFLSFDRAVCKKRENLLE